MGSLTNYGEQKFIDHALNTAWSAPATVYLALCTADPTDAATGASMSEVANLYAYARTAITFGAAGSRTITQNAAVDFPAANGGSWGTVSHWAIVDTNTYGSGNVLAHGAFQTSKTIADGNDPEVASGEVYVTIDANEWSNYYANAWLDKAFRAQTFAKPDTYLAAIITNPVTDSDTGSTITEPSGFGYARKQVNPNGGSSPTWDTVTQGDPTYSANTHAITFASASGGDWGTVIAIAIVDALTVGNLIAYDNTMADTVISDGDTLQFPVGDLDIQMS